MVRSKKSEQFVEWLKDLTPEKIERLVELEQSSRVLIHVWDMVESVNAREIHSLARVTKQIQAEYGS